MRIRTVKPEFWTDPKIGKISRDARLLFIGLWSVCDDFGVCQSNFEFLKGQLFSYDKISSKKFAKWINELLTQNLIIPFEANGDKYFHVKHFNRHQVISRPSKFRNPVPPTLTEQSVNTHGTITVGGVMVMEGKGGVMEVEGESEGKPKVNPFLLSKEEDKTKPRKTWYPNEALTPKERIGREQETEKRKEELRIQAKELGVS